VTTRALVVGLVWAELVREACRRYWRRLLVGAFVGWALASVAGAIGVVLLEPHTSLASSQVAAVCFVWVGVLAGAVTAYARRRDDVEA